MTPKEKIDYKGIRKKYNLTQGEMAQLLGLSSQVRISEYEHYKTKPSKPVRILYRIIEKYGIDIVKQLSNNV